MKLIVQNAKAAVYDDVFVPEHWNKVQNFIRNEHFRSMLLSPVWIKTWRLGDCMPLVGKEYFFDKPGPPEVEMVKTYVKQILEHSKFGAGWTNYSITPYLYPRGTKISWHNDQGYKAAAIFYTHTHWGSTWGGELMLAETPTEQMRANSQHLEHEAEDEFMAHFGMGTYITPKPNRCVVTPGGVWHSINRVDPDAGDHVRSSLVVFFK